MTPENRRNSLSPVLIVTFIIFIIIHCRSSRQPFDIDVEEVKMMIENGENPPAIIDVRTREEYFGDLGHIPGSRLIPIDVFKDSIEALSHLKDSTVIVVCHAGYRSKRAVLWLLDNDFKNAYNLYGGMVAWNRAGEKMNR